MKARVTDGSNKTVIRNLCKPKIGRGTQKDDLGPLSTVASATDGARTDDLSLAIGTISDIDHRRMFAESIK